MSPIAAANIAIVRTIHDPATPHWMVEVLSLARSHDPVDLANGAEQLWKLLRDRADAILAKLTG